MKANSSHTKLLYRRERGSILIMTVILISMIIGFMGVTLYLGIQSYAQSELQKAATSAAMVGASSMYTSTGTAAPTKNVNTALAAANTTFTAIRNSSPALQAFYQSHSITPGANDTLSITVQGNINAGLLSFAGINQIEVQANATARAVQYLIAEPSRPLYILPQANNPQSFFVTTAKTFPIIDRQGNDIYIEQSVVSPFSLEACSANSCYNLAPGAVSSGGTINGQWLSGNLLIDMNAAGVSKASMLKVSDDGNYTSTINGTTYLNTKPPGTRIDRISVFGYSSLCPNANTCPVPAGFSAY